MIVDKSAVAPGIFIFLGDHAFFPRSGYNEPEAERVGISS